MPIHPTELLRPRPRQRARRLLHRWWCLGHWEIWFPHAPLALIVGALGLINLLPVVRYTLGLHLYTGASTPPSRALELRVLHDMPQGIAGLMLLAMALGLLLRSRLSWAIALLVVAATLAIAWHGSAHHSRALIFFNGATLLALLFFHRRFDRSSLAAGTLFAAISVLLLLGYAVFGAYVLGQDFSPPITSLSTATYFAVVTMSTVGYGDIVPKGLDARFFVMSVIILGITVFATSISAIIVPAVSGRVQRLIEGRKKPMPRKHHYVIVGDTPLARNTYRELKARQLPVTVIVGQNPGMSDFADADLVVGDAGDVEILKEAGAADAIAVLALLADDSENAFTVLAVKELGGAARTVAAVNHGKNMARVRGVRPDMVIAPQVMGGELLAMALNGENLDSETLIERLFKTNEATKTDQGGDA